MKNVKNIEEITKLNIKGQITIPNVVRKFYLKGSKYIGFKITPEGILLVPIEIKEKEPYTTEEWHKIEALASQKGKVCKNAKAARKHLDSL